MLTYMIRFGRTIIAEDNIDNTDVVKVWVGWFSFFSFRYWCFPTHTYFGVKNGYR